MDFQEAIKSCLSKYVEFSGRAPRSEFWFWYLFQVLVAIAALIVDGVLGTGGLLYMGAVFGLFLPGLAVTVRRLHDIGKSGWFYLFILIPLVGPILLLVWFCQDSDGGDNQYGPNPLG
jgi:uncharacterized membrane protein YhaH (DUF805 family)